MFCSVIIPVFNAENTLEELCVRISDALKSDFELILVDDGSDDNSWNIIRKLSGPVIKGIRLARNFGQHNATLCGIAQAKGDYIVTIDDDLQHDPSSIPVLLEKIRSSNSEIVYGIYTAHQTTFRKSVSGIWKFLAKNVNDGIGKGSSFRVIKKELAQKLSNHKQPFVFIDEIINWYTKSIGFVLVPHHKRKSGKSAYTKRKLFTLTSDLIIFYSSFPLKLMTWSGIFFSLVSFSFGLFFLVKKIFFKVNVPGFTALIVTIFFTTSIILLCFGILGEYIRRMYLVMNAVPNHHIAERTE